MSNNNGNENMKESDNMITEGTDSSEQCLQRSVSALSVSSIASSTSSIPLKRSGLKLPSRIGRPCDGQPHKLAVPTSPHAHNYDVGRVANNFNRYTRLSDLLEEDSTDYLRFSTMSSYRRRYSSTGSSSSSMDHLWELYPHRLREAGLSRYSDSSTILTEDTDSFIIGQRVWVGGTKPGTIAFIGETQFAPGEWAGVVLDDAVGKNDGSVAGIKYFQCESKRGVFSRLTRLTRQPLEVPHSYSNESFSTPANGIRSPISPSGSTRSLLRSPLSHHASNTSLTSMSTSVIIDYKIGDRVIIKSSQGSKVGTVKFIGYTEFAPGEWVGVELDDPRGKNDGSVEGKRYFTCQQNYGLFAPVGKVSKSPSKVKPGSCAVHNSGLPPSGLRRCGSKESMTSAASSIRRVRLGVNSLTPKRLPLKSPTTPRPSLQDMVKDKQQHIEQLLKERDLERQEFTKAASQAEEAEHQLVVVKKEFDAYRTECNVKLQEHMVLLSELKKDRAELLGQLDDEKKKNEDLLFKFEEASILKSDVEAGLEKKIREIEELRKLLDIERNRADDTEKNSNKLFETEESLMKAYEEIEKLKTELENITLEHKSLKEDGVLTTDQTELLEKELEITKKQLGELNTIRNTLSQQLATATIESAQEKESSEVLKKKLTFYENELTQKDQKISNLNNELETTKKSLSENEKEVQQLKLNQSEQQADLSKELEKLKMEMSSKTFDIETTNDELKMKQEEIKALIKKSEEMKLGYETQINEKTNLHKESAETLAKELHQTKDELDSAKKSISEISQTSEEKIKELFKDKGQLEKELEKIKSDIENSSKNAEEESSMFKSKIKENEEAIVNYEREIKSLREELDGLKKSANSSNSELQNQLEQFKQESSRTIETLQNDLKIKGLENISLSSEYAKIQQDFQIKSTELESVNNSLQKVTEESSKLKEYNQKLDLDIGHFRNTVESLEKKLEEVETQKKSANSSNSDLQNQLGLMKQENTKLNESLQNDLKIEKEKTNSLSSEYSKLQHDLEIKSTQLQSVETSLKTITEVSSKLNDEKQQLDLNNGDLKRNIETLERKLEDVEIQKKQMYEEIQSLINSSGDNSANLEEMRTKLFENQTLLDKTKNEHQEKLQNLERQIQEKTMKLEERESQVLKIEKDLSEAKESFETIDYTNRKRIGELIEEISKIKESHIKEIDDQHKNVSEKEMQLETIKNECSEKLQIIEIKIQEKTLKLEEKDNRILELEKKLLEFGKSLENKEATYKQNIEELTKQIEQMKNNQAAQTEKNLKENSEKESVIQHHVTTIQTLENKLKEQIEKSESYVDEIVKSYQDKIANLNQQRDELEETTKKLELELKEYKEMNDKQEKDLGLEVNELKNTIGKMTTTISEISSENEKFKQQLDISQNTIQQKNLEIVDSKKISDEKEQIMSKKIEHFEKISANLSDESSALNNANEELKREIEKKCKELEEINLKFQKYVESNELNSNDKEQSYLKQISDLESKVKEMNIALEETNTLKQNTEKEFNEKCVAYDANSKEMKSLLEKINLYEEKLRGIEEEKSKIQGALEYSNNTMQEKENLYKEMCSQMEIISEKYKSLESALNEEKLKNIDSMKNKNEREEALRNECKELSNQLQVVFDKSQEHESQTIYIIEALQKLQFTQKQKNDLIEIFGKQQKSDLQRSMLNLRDDYVDEMMINRIKELERSLEKFKNELNDERRKCATQSTEMYVLEQKLNSVATKQNHVVAKSKDAVGNPNSNNNEQCDYQQLLEDKLSAENQVQFLNSIIVDMQKKNEQQKAKIEILESGYSPAAADELNLMGFSSSTRQLPPRMYCDICDCFDLHETEDCPKQMSEVMPPPRTDKIKKKPEPRPYCELCEAFGHDTQDCPEDETF